MAYKQKWGMSRSKSPLNNTGKPKSIMDPNYVDVDPSKNDIVQQNNKLSTNQLLAQKSKIFTPGIDVTNCVAK